MFTTLRCGKNSMTTERSVIPTGGVLDTQHSACNYCRSKKLRCNGSKSGCQRCRKLNIGCSFSESMTDRAVKKRRQAQESPRTPRGTSSSSFDSSGAPVPAVDPSSCTVNPHSAASTVTHLPLDHGNTFQGPNNHTPSIPPLENQQAPSPLSPGRQTSFKSQASPYKHGDYGLAVNTNIIPAHAHSGSMPGFLGHNGSFAELASAQKSVHNGLGIEELFAADFHLHSPPATREPHPTYSFHTAPLSPQSLDPSSPQSVLDASTLESRMESPSLSSHSERESVSAGSGYATSFTSMNTCDCAKTALNLLEMLEKSQIQQQGIPQRIDRLLGIHKEIIARCFRLQECNQCCSDSGFMILLTMLVCQKLPASFELVFAAIHARGAHIGAMPVNDKMHMAAQGLDLGEYQINEPEEFESICATVMTLHLHKVQALMQRMDDLAAYWRWEAHHAMIASGKAKLAGLLAASQQI